MLSLKTVMRSNAASCLIFGAIFALQSSQVAVFLSEASPAPHLLVFALGLILILNGLHLIWASTILLPKKLLILYFSAGDFIWVIISAVLLLSKLWITAYYGVLATIAVAIIVGFFGVAQILKIKSMGHH